MGRDRAPDYEGARVDGLDRVVRTREQLLVRTRGHILAVAAELGQPVAIDVRLVADNHVPHLRDTADEIGCQGPETVVVTFRPAIFNCNVLPFDKTEFV